MVQYMGFSIFGYADDHQILKTFKAKNQHFCLTEDLCNCFYQIKKWMRQYFLYLNADKTQIIIFGLPHVLQLIKIRGIFLEDDVVVRFVSTVKNLGILMDSALTMENQIMEIKQKSFTTIRKVHKIRFLLTKHHLKAIVNSLVISCLDYCNALYYGIGQKLLATNSECSLENCHRKT